MSLCGRTKNLELLEPRSLWAQSSLGRSHAAAWEHYARSVIEHKTAAGYADGPDDPKRSAYIDFLISAGKSNRKEDLNSTSPVATSEEH